MAEAEPTPLHRGLPDAISIWEILVRLPPKALLRCRAVCPAWRHATSTRAFLLAHHARQPSLPLLYGYNSAGNHGRSIDILSFDQRAGLAVADQFQSVRRFGGNTFFTLEASCDGLIIHSSGRTMQFSICNPETRQYAPLQQLDGYRILGMYRHNPTGEYRLLLYPRRRLMRGECAQIGACIFTLGSGHPPRHIAYADAEELARTSHYVMFRGNLHWHLHHRERARTMLIVFDTTAESFRQRRAPVVPPGRTDLFELDGMLGISSFNDAETTIDIWMTQDYDSDEWTFKYRVELPVAELTVKFGKFNSHWSVVVASSDGDALVLAKFGDWLLQIDMDGKLVASFHHELLSTTQFRLKQTLIRHTFSPTLEGYVVNDSPFI